MSKASKKRARRRKARREKLVTVLCPDCLMSTSGYTPEQMLLNVAAALNAMRDVKMVVRPKFVLAHDRDGGGFILPPLDRNGSWTVHMQTARPQHMPAMLDDEDDLDS